MNVRTPSLSTGTAAIECPFPGSPEVAHASFAIDEARSLNAADLRAVRNAVVGFPRQWFDSIEQHKYDHSHCCRWATGYVYQISGPLFISNFSIFKDSLGYTVHPDDGDKRPAQWQGRPAKLKDPLGHAVHPDDEDKLPAEWQGFPTIDAACAAIWMDVDKQMRAYGLEILIKKQ